MATNKLPGDTGRLVSFLSEFGNLFFLENLRNSTPARLVKNEDLTLLLAMGIWIFHCPPLVLEGEGTAYCLATCAS